MFFHSAFISASVFSSGHVVMVQSKHSSGPYSTLWIMSIKRLKDRFAYDPLHVDSLSSLSLRCILKQKLKVI